jgi:hypothetical protein
MQSRRGACADCRVAGAQPQLDSEIVQDQLRLEEIILGGVEVAGLERRFAVAVIFFRLRQLFYPGAIGVTDSARMRELQRDLAFDLDEVGRRLALGGKCGNAKRKAKDDRNRYTHRDAIFARP